MGWHRCQAPSSWRRGSHPNGTGSVHRELSCKACILYRATNTYEHGLPGAMAASTYDELEVLCECKLEDGESALKGIMRIVDAAGIERIRKGNTRKGPTYEAKKSGLSR